MNAHLRIARPVADPRRAAARYQAGLDLRVLGSFVDHGGFDGVMLGTPGGGYHLEFTCCRTHAVAPSPTPEDLLVFYVPEPDSWRRRCEAMRAAGFREVAPYNPYWQRLGCTFEDPDGYRVVIQQAPWENVAVDR